MFIDNCQLYLKSAAISLLVLVNTPVQGKEVCQNPGALRGSTSLANVCANHIDFTALGDKITFYASKDGLSHGLVFAEQGQVFLESEFSNEQSRKKHCVLKLSQETSKNHINMNYAYLPYYENPLTKASFKMTSDKFVETPIVVNEPRSCEDDKNYICQYRNYREYKASFSARSQNEGGATDVTLTCRAPSYNCQGVCEDSQMESMNLKEMILLMNSKFSVGVEVDAHEEI